MILQCITTFNIMAMVFVILTPSIPSPRVGRSHHFGRPFEERKVLDFGHYCADRLCQRRIFLVGAPRAPTVNLQMFICSAGALVTRSARILSLISFGPMPWFRALRWCGIYWLSNFRRSRLVGRVFGFNSQGVIFHFAVFFNFLHQRPDRFGRPSGQKAAEGTVWM